MNTTTSVFIKEDDTFTAEPLPHEAHVMVCFESRDYGSRLTLFFHTETEDALNNLITALTQAKTQLVKKRQEREHASTQREAPTDT